MARLDVENLFENIPFEESMENIMIYFYQLIRFIILKGKDLNNLWLLQYMNHFSFLMGEYYNHIDDATIGSPLGQTFSSVFLCHFFRKSTFQNIL